ncbi:MAG: peptidylprolyl isomerase [Bryobacteraceae bacterium]|nr:peptidylprolyl isomerase [Bryobacteraceae bacterium]
MRYFFVLMLPAAALLAQTPAAKPPATKPAASAPKAAPAAKPPVATESKPAPAPATAPAAAPAAAPVAPPETAPDAVVLTVGEEKITRAEWEQFAGSLPEQLRAQATGPNKRRLAEQLADLKVMSREAERRKLNESVEVRRQLELQRQNLLASALFEELQKTAAVDDASLRKLYDDRKANFEQISARHILVRMQGSQVPLKKDQKDLTEQEALAKAQELKKKIAGGADFAEVAKAESDDTGSGASGGLLGTFSRGQMVPAFEQAAFALPVGQVSDPVKTQFGYHLIRVDEHKTQPYEEVKGTLEQQAKPAAARKVIQDLRKSAGVVIDETYFGKSAQ